MSRSMIVVPCYNEAERLHTAAFLAFAERHPHVRFLLVNDGSTDGTLAVLERLAGAQPDRFAVLNLRANQGKAEAVRQGVLQAMAEEPDVVGYWDADLATPLEAIDELSAVLQREPRLRIVIGARVKLLGRSIERRALRHYLGRIFATAASTVLGLGVYDTQCGAKVFRVCDETRALFLRPFCSRWVFDVELLARFVRGRVVQGLRAPEQAIYEYPLRSWRDVAGSKVRPRDFFKAFIELGRIYWRYLRGLRPIALPATGAETVGPGPALPGLGELESGLSAEHAEPAALAEADQQAQRDAA